MRLHASFALFAFAAPVAAQTGSHSCAADPAAQQVYNQHRDSNDRVEALRAALKTSPGDLFLNRWLLLSHSIRVGSLAEEYKEKLDAHPGDPLYVYLYAHALIGKETPKAIELINLALAKDPELVYAHETLLEVYSTPAFRDPTQIARNLQAFTARCPSDVSVYSHLKDVDDAPVLAGQTAKFRAAVEARNTVGVAAVYRNLWAAEFRVESPENYGRLRSRIREDMKRIRELDPDNIDESRSLREGYLHLGDTASADGLKTTTVPVKKFFDIFQDWSTAHPYWNSLDQEAKNRYQDEMLEASARWVKDWPLETNAWYWRMLAIARHRSSTRQEIERAGEDVLASDAKTYLGWASVPYPSEVAKVWAEHDIRLRDCLGLLQQGLFQLEGHSSRFDDRFPGANASSMVPAQHLAFQRFEIWSTEAQVHRKLGDSWWNRPAPPKPPIAGMRE